MNLAEGISFGHKGYIYFTYDANGTKLRKITWDSVAKHITFALYLNGFVYQYVDTLPSSGLAVDTLQYVGQEEGRARWAFHKYTNGTTGYGWEYDFMEKDHLGNTRVLLTQQKDTARYSALWKGLTGPPKMPYFTISRPLFMQGHLLQATLWIPA